MFCLCLQQSGLWILDVARPVGRALKDDGKVGECILVERNVKWIAASGINATPRNDASGEEAPACRNDKRQQKRATIRLPL
jgi:hypothetical protein